jgi:hypothetical protein
VLIVTQHLAQFSDALYERVIRDGDARPDGLMKLLLQHKAAGIFREMA